MRGLFAIVWMSLQEYLRDRVLYGGAMAGLLLVASAALFSRLTVGNPDRIILDLGLGAVHFFSTVMAVFLGIGVIGREVDRRTIHLILAKPVPRSRLILGKFVGLSLMLLLNLGVLCLPLMLVLMLLDVPMTLGLWQAVALIYAETCLVMGVALLCTTFTTAALSAVFTVAFYVIGHSVAYVQAFGDKLEGIARACVTGFAHLVPDLEYFNLKGYVPYQQSLPAVDFTFVVGYALAYMACLLLAATVIFQRRDFV
jgi:ABC-type transport system involved in multi-copper enzyme maturation permease subunit